MSEQRKSEITVGAGVADWGEELVAQWNVLGDTIARSLQQRARQEQEQGQRERQATASELDRMRAALAESEAKAVMIARESAIRLDAMRREYENKLALLQQELEQHGHAHEPSPAISAAAPEHVQEHAADYSAESQPAAEARWGAESEWETNETETSGRSRLADLLPIVGEQWSRVRSGPYLIPVVGFLAGLAVMVSLYPLLHHPPAGLAKETVSAKGSPAPAKANEVARSSNKPSPAANAPAPAVAGVAAATEGTNATPASDSKPAPELADQGNYAVLLAGGKLLTPDKPGAPSVAYEARLALRAGYDSISVYQRNDRYMAAVLFRSREEAERGLKSINADFDSRWKRTSSIVPVSEWCRVKGALEPVVINGVEVAVWSCNKTPS